MQPDIHHSGHSCANTTIRPSGNVASSEDSNSSGLSSLSSNGESSQPANRNVAPTKSMSPSPSNDTAPVAASADKMRVPELPQCICVASPCSSTTSRTGPNVIIDSRSRHSFNLRNAPSQETLSIGSAHMRGVKKAQWLANRFEWRSAHSMADLLAAVEQLDATSGTRYKKCRQFFPRAV